VSGENISIGSPSQVLPKAVEALALACERFPNLCASGILPRRVTGSPINPTEVSIALSFLGRCRHTTRPTVHSVDLCRHVRVSAGAIIAAAVTLGFTVRGWYGVTAYYPHAVMNVNRLDIRKARARS
jgi:hypothetical protein